MTLPVAAARYNVADIKTLLVISEFCINLREFTWKLEDFYGDFSDTILKEKHCVNEKL